MAKKSAASKGYRKTEKKKPFLTKKEIIQLIIIVAVIAAGIFLFTYFYSDGFLGADEVQPGDIVSYANANRRTRYAKVGTIGEIEGFTREEIGGGNSKVVTYAFTPEEGTDEPVHYVSVSANYVPAEQLCDNVMMQLAMQITDDSLSLSDKWTLEIQGRPAVAFMYNNAYYNPEIDPEVADIASLTSEEIKGMEKNTFKQGIGCYVAVDDEHTLTYSLYLDHEDESSYIDQAQAGELLEEYSAAFSVAEKE